ncbi:hypothetical protein TWF481_010047 [Arthrobotrys musiformis]|uniref:Uncharacterized protein n=1 Tax=Arthrobotrys musiformis TaxID=47236 RepID=A0AAV9W1Q3_9PEZI
MQMRLLFLVICFVSSITAALISIKPLDKADQCVENILKDIGLSGSAKDTFCSIAPSVLDLIDILSNLDASTPLEVIDEVNKEVMSVVARTSLVHLKLSLISPGKSAMPLDWHSRERAYWDANEGYEVVET